MATSSKPINERVISEEIKRIKFKDRVSLAILAINNITPKTWIMASHQPHRASPNNPTNQHPIIQPIRPRPDPVLLIQQVAITPLPLNLIPQPPLVHPNPAPKTSLTLTDVQTHSHTAIHRF